MRYPEFVDLFLVTLEQILLNQQMIKIKEFFLVYVEHAVFSDTRLKGHISPGIKKFP